VGVAQETSKCCDTVEMRRGHLDNSSIEENAQVRPAIITSPIPSDRLVNQKRQFNLQADTHVEVLEIQTTLEISISKISASTVQ